MFKNARKSLRSFHQPALLIAFSLCASVARAQFLIRIGDADGFGYQSAPGFFAANGGFANRDSIGILASRDRLPDINRDGAVATGRGDDFDLRTASEIANTSLSVGNGVTNIGTVGSKFTDISLSTSYDTSSSARTVLIGGNPNTGLIRGAGGPFPTPPASTLPNQPGFVFQFSVDKNALSSSSLIFFNLVFGDYDVVPADIQLTKANNSTRILNLVQQDSAVADGLIQAATATLNFGDVFTDGGSVWTGSLKVDFIAPNEPYTAFDYVELSTIPLVGVPEPGVVTLFLAGLTGAGWMFRRRQQTR